jgi:hypothetical protein
MAPDEVRAADAAYVPFPTFVEWRSRATVDGARWDQIVSRLDAYRDVPRRST